jgi:hypothetical protein
LYRLRTPAETVSLAVTLIAHGCPLQAIVVAFGYDERTVACWLARAGVHGQAVQEHLVEPPRDLSQVQADEIRVKKQGGLVWMALAAGITDHGWSVYALLSYHVPPPCWTPPKQRGRPSHALKHLIARWCGEHG